MAEDMIWELRDKETGQALFQNVMYTKCLIEAKRLGLKSGTYTIKRVPRVDEGWENPGGSL